MKIVSWNINSLKARLQHVKDYLAEERPDVLMVQELKGAEFPDSEFSGYHTEFVGQKAYNGVAIFSKTEIETLHKALPADDADEQARYLEVDIDGVRLINIYLPNGNPVPGDKYEYKLAWMDRLYSRLKTLRNQSKEFIIGGDFNIIPDEKDCYDPQAWADDALFRLESRQKFRALEHLGLYDAFRVHNKGDQNYTFWDYQAGAWPKNHGIRIDHFLLSPLYADALTDCRIDTAPRDKEKPSDHTPIVLEIKSVQSLLKEVA